MPSWHYRRYHCNRRPPNYTLRRALLALALIAIGISFLAHGCTFPSAYPTP